MFRKISAISLLLLMVVAVATAQRGLRFCLCHDEFFVGACECPIVSEEPTEPGDCHTEGCCGSETNKSELELTGTTKTCFVDLFVDTGKYTKSERKASGFESPEDELAGLPTVELVVVKTSDRFVDDRERGPPDLWREDFTVPIYIRHSVFLI